MPAPLPCRVAVRLLAAGVPWLLGACAVQQAGAPPLDAAAAQARWMAVSPESAQVRAALARQQVEVGVWPLPCWDLHALSALALAVHPDMAVARAEVAAVAARRQTLLQRANPGLDLVGEHHSAPGATDSPWTVGLAVDVSLTDTLFGQARRRAVAAGADARDRQALHAAAATAWQVHQRVRDSRRALFDALAAAEGARALLPLRREDDALWQVRLAHGAADARDAAAARQRLAEAERAVAEAEAEAGAARLRLSVALGLAPEQGARLTLDLHDLEREPPGQGAALDPPTLQRVALQDRLDVRAALAGYAAAAAQLQVELARQWPEVRLRPGYEWDQGDNRWQLGLGLVLPTWDRNAGPIAEARASLAALCAQFTALQAQAIGALAAAEASIAAADAARAAAEAAQAAAAAARARADRRLAAGDADRSETLGARLEAASAARGVQSARAAQRAARDGLEDVLQRPLDGLAVAVAP